VNVRPLLALGLHTVSTLDVDVTLLLRQNLPRRVANLQVVHVARKLSVLAGGVGMGGYHCLRDAILGRTTITIGTKDGCKRDERCRMRKWRIEQYV
jgi:hypothetical protein